MSDKVKAYCTVSTSSPSYVLLNRYFQIIEEPTRLDPHSRLIIASHHFKDPYVFIGDIVLLRLAIMDLLIQFAYPCLSGYAKFSITYTMMRTYGEEFSFTIGKAIPLTNDKNDLLDKSDVLREITRMIQSVAELYEGNCIHKVMIRVYMDSDKLAISSPQEEERVNLLLAIIEGRLPSSDACAVQPAIKINSRKRKPRIYPSYITSLKTHCKELKGFIVADLETLVVIDKEKI